jgi:hypothetical protein
MVLWDEVVESVQKDYPDAALRKCHVDALAARMITAPQTIDVTSPRAASKDAAYGNSSGFRDNRSSLESQRWPVLKG